MTPLLSPAGGEVPDSDGTVDGGTGQQEKTLGIWVEPDHTHHAL